jgi:hypothetical protein
MQDQFRYFRSQVYTADQEISEAETRESGGYVAAVFSEDSPVYAEVRGGGGGVTKVVYYDRPAADAAHAEAHAAKYGGGTPFEVITQTLDEGGRRARDIYHYGGGGALAGIDREWLDERGEVTSEVHMDAGRRVVSRVEYEYGDDGALTRAQEFDADGTLIDEYKF